MAGPLKGIKIIEMVGIGPCPFASMMLADMGAEIIRIHPIGRERLFPHLNSKLDVLARGRKSISLDVKTPKGKEALLHLISKADAIVEGFRPGVMEKLGIGPEQCFECNKKIVFGRMTGWGQNGPLAQRAGHDINYIALTGVLNAIGQKGARPAVPLNLVGDFAGGSYLAFGVVCAILEARVSGQGQIVDAAMIDSTASLAAMVYGFKAGGLWNNDRGSNMLDGGMHFYDTYECSDGKFMAVGAIEPQFYKRLIEILDIEGIDLRKQHDLSSQETMRTLLQNRFAAKTQAEWTKLFEDEDACVSPVLNWDEAIAHPHNVERSVFTDIDGVDQPLPAPRFSRTVPEIPEPPTAADENTNEILSDWGLPQSEIEALHECGAVK